MDLVAWGKNNAKLPQDQGPIMPEASSGHAGIDTPSRAFNKFFSVIQSSIIGKEESKNKTKQNKITPEVVRSDRGWL
jgi:hypothetical protein